MSPVERSHAKTAPKPVTPALPSVEDVAAGVVECEVFRTYICVAAQRGEQRLVVLDFDLGDEARIKPYLEDVHAAELMVSMFRTLPDALQENVVNAFAAIRKGGGQ